ncbi:MAG TPA: xylulokinase [Actinophytocola sp.]|uniref:xylulokinase n=1 Tax=Actinophytocola sp. TaxID=1872138 RepID=UPI002DB8807E|nr:xylulokinase [Actinophytocola sp.]HEU5469437.1 xylulokinase [Actinophytocola sp.]
MTLVLGIDSSTQSTKALLTDADTGKVVGEGRAAHPDGTEVDPAAWWQACQDAIAQATAGSAEPPAAVSVAGQQHGMVAMDAAGQVVRPALLWNDTRSADQARRLVQDGAGPAWWAEHTGSVPVASFTVTKLAWLAEHEPDNADRVAAVALPHDWLTWQLAGRPERITTDRGDASGTGYFSPWTGAWLPEVLDAAFGGRRPRLPEVLGPAEPAGQTAHGAVPAAAGAVLAPGTGDNMAAALALGLGPGDVVVSLGTSGTVFATVDTPAADASGLVAGFCDATGRYLPLVCTLNAARVLGATAGMLGTDLAGLDALALRAEPGSGGLVMLPYLEGERTPDLPNATGTLVGLRGANMTPENLARAAVEGMLCGLADGLAALRATGVEVRRVLLIGGASRSSAVQAVAAGLFGVPVDVPDPDEYVALGAARQAAWVLAGGAEPPAWHRPSRTLEPTGDGTAVLGPYSAARQQVYG